MAEDKVEGREIPWRNLLPWTVLFRAFRVAASPSKLLLAAAGIFVMALGWLALASTFSTLYRKPDFDLRYQSLEDGWKRYRDDRAKWNVFYEAAGDPNKLEMLDADDLAEAYEERESITKFADQLRNKKETWAPTQFTRDPETARQIQDKWEYRIKHRPRINIDEMARELNITKPEDKVRLKAWLIVYREENNIPKPGGALRTLPWFEPRGPNQVLLLTGRKGIPWEAGHFWDWFLTVQVPVLIEPLMKLISPVLYFFSPGVGLVGRLYFFLVVLWTLAVWALFGGAITRMAAVEVARNEKIGALEALRFVIKRYTSYFLAPLLPLILLGVLLLGMVIFGLLHLIPLFGDVVVDGLGWPFMILAGLLMACVLIGLISWPMMTATISAEDEESLNAAARSYSYLVQAPWHYIWYTVVALLYGGVVIFFVGFMGSLTVYLSKFGVSTVAAVAPQRDPSFLFIYAPTSFEWRTLLLEGATTPGGDRVVVNGVIDKKAYENYVGALVTYNKIGAVLVAFWLYLLFLVVLGFGYSYFWTASTIIYLLMRKRVDDAELDEVFFEEEEQDEFAPPPGAGPKPPPPPPPSPGQVMVEPPTLRVPPPPAPSPPPPVAPVPSAPQEDLFPPQEPPARPDDDLPLKRD